MHFLLNMKYKINQNVLTVRKNYRPSITTKLLSSSILLSLVIILFSLIVSFLMCIKMLNVFDNTIFHLIMFTIWKEFDSYFGL